MVRSFATRFLINTGSIAISGGFMAQIGDFKTATS